MEGKVVAGSVARETCKGVENHVDDEQKHHDIRWKVGFFFDVARREITLLEAVYQDCKRFGFCLRRPPLCKNNGVGFA